jgi:hypothetical protein
MTPELTHALAVIAGGLLSGLGVWVRMRRGGAAPAAPAGPVPAQPQPPAAPAPAPAAPVPPVPQTGHPVIDAVIQAWLSAMLQQQQAQFFQWAAQQAPALPGPAPAAAK